MKTLQSIEIARAPDRVFWWLEDPERAKNWMQNVSETEILVRHPGVVGTTFTEKVVENGQGTTLNGTITRFERNRSIAFHLDGKYNAVDVEYILVQIAEGTRLTVDAHIRFKSLTRVLMFFFGRAFAKKIGEELHGELEKLKELCEAQ